MGNTQPPSSDLTAGGERNTPLFKTTSCRPIWGGPSEALRSAILPRCRHVMQMGNFSYYPTPWISEFAPATIPRHGASAVTALLEANFTGLPPDLVGFCSSHSFAGCPTAECEWHAAASSTVSFTQSAVE